MSQNNGHSSPSKLDAYLDRQLTASEVRSFEARLAGEPALRDCVARHHAIDRSLQAIFTPDADAAERSLAQLSLPADASSLSAPATAPALTSVLASALEPAPDAAAAILEMDAADQSPSLGSLPAPHPRPVLQTLWRWRNRVAVAALLMLAGGAGVYAWRAADHAARFTPLGYARVDAVYQNLLSRDPNAWCEDDQEFASVIYHHTGTGLLVPATLPQAVVVNGFRRCACFSNDSLVLMTKVEGRPVLVMIDRLAKEQPQALSANSKLKLFRKQIGTAVLYEVSPFDSPRLLDLFYDPQMPKDWYKSGW